jgi:hypothetical protein
MDMSESLGRAIRALSDEEYKRLAETFVSSPGAVLTLQIKRTGDNSFESSLHTMPGQN